jgi:parallel beta-helix repeat protein
VATTVINGRSLDAVVTFSGGEDANCVLAGFTVTGAHKGIYCSGASPTVTKCAIVGNAGAGIKLWNESNLTVTNCTITANGGDGIEMQAERSGRFIKYNYATVRDCVIAGNQNNGILGSIPTVANCTIVGNRQRGISSMGTTISNSVVCSNGHGYDLVQIEAFSTTVSYSNVQGGWSGIGNIDADPCFVGPGYWADANDPNVPAEQGDPNAIWVGSDCHLLPDSPCIDAGDPNYILKSGETDLDGNSRVTGEAIDMGAFESQTMIELSEEEFEFEAVIGFAGPPDQLLLVRNSGAGTLDWQITCDCAWLTFSQNTGSSKRGGNAVILGVDAAGLAAGNYDCAMTISAPFAVNSPKLVPVRLVVNKNCFPDTPEYAQQYADFLAYLALGFDPSCWCAAPNGSGFQCDGDADGDTQTPQEYRVFTNDLLCVIENWRKKITDPTIDPCCDFDHKAETYLQYRVFGNDLAIVVANWKKTSSELPGDCPRPNGQ